MKVSLTLSLENELVGEIEKEIRALQVSPSAYCAVILANRSARKAAQNELRRRAREREPVPA